MKYDKNLMLSKELSAVQKILDSYKKFTQPFEKYSKIYAKSFDPCSKLALSTGLKNKMFIPHSSATQTIARKMQYTAILNSKAMPVGLKKSMLAPSIKLSSSITDTYLNSPAIISLQKSIQKLQNTYTSSVQQQAIELITVSQKLFSSTGYPITSTIEDFVFDDDCVAIPIDFADAVSENLEGPAPVFEDDSSKTKIVKTELFIAILNLILLAVSTYYTYISNQLQAESNRISKEQLKFDKKYKLKELEQKDRELDQKDRELDQKDRELDQKDKELRIQQNKSNSKN